MIVIIDYGMGNLRSVQKGFERLHIKAITSSNIDDINRADKIILPGVGHFARGMQHLKDLNLIDLLNEKVLVKKTPVLGICLGMQLLTNFSEEGNCEGLGWINAETLAFNLPDNNKSLKIPHMGWNNIRINEDNLLFKNSDSSLPFYFVHSFYVKCNDESELTAKTIYGSEFASVVNKENIFGTQFHPEKSHKQGINLLKNFAELE